MGPQLQNQFPDWRSGVGDGSWLSTLIDAMEEASRPERRSVPCDRMVLAAVHAQLARPALPCVRYTDLPSASERGFTRRPIAAAAARSFRRRAVWLPRA